jgi:hypothetical protein
MNHPKFEVTKELLEFDNMMATLLLNGEIVAGIKEEVTGSIWTKVTRFKINGNEIFGFWERSLFSDEWILNSAGNADKVENDWKEFTSEMQNCGIGWRIGVNQ